ncbi:hypothetical protein Hypma_012729 [Hypsizygus marmoreus]|uniref:Uncharacterized protein n=1 Tax=Hypsizygus marmoreus TaxID=39966 RepID=A0A369JHX3_HYPMA|nr:hypothetical protein Hypma_012729 [Hypsizygus marmoreus]
MSSPITIGSALTAKSDVNSFSSSLTNRAATLSSFSSNLLPSSSYIFFIGSSSPSDNFKERMSSVTGPDSNGIRRLNLKMGSTFECTLLARSGYAEKTVPQVRAA